MTDAPAPDAETPEQPSPERAADEGAGPAPAAPPAEDTPSDGPPERAPREGSPAEAESGQPAGGGAQLDIPRLVLAVLLVAGGLVYFFWDNVHDVLQPPEIVEVGELPTDVRMPGKQFEVTCGRLAITFTKVGAAVTEMTWHGEDGHAEPLITQDEVSNRAFVVSHPALRQWVNHEFTVLEDGSEAKSIQRDGRTVPVKVVRFEQFVPGGPRLIKTFTVHSDRPLIELTVEVRDLPPGGWISGDGYTLHLSNSLGTPSELDKDDCLISVRADEITDHHRVRRLSGERDWPTEKETKREAHGGGERAVSLEWVATANRYFALIVRPDTPLLSAVEKKGQETPAPVKLLTFARTADCAARTELHVPPPRPDSTVMSNTFHVYAGPKQYEDLRQLGARQQEVINYWYFGRLLTLLLQWVSGQVGGNYGVAILLVTLVFRLLMWPVTRYNLRSLVNVKIANARLDDIDAREPPRSQREERAWWLKEARVWEKVQDRARLGMFLPLLILIPLLLVLYYTLNVGYEFYRQPFVLWITDISEPDPYFILPILMGLAMMAQLVTMSENPAKERSWILMPVLFAVLFGFFSAGLVLFWLVDSLAGWGQLLIIKRGGGDPRAGARSIIQRAEQRVADIRAAKEAASEGPTS